MLNLCLFVEELNFYLASIMSFVTCRCVSSLHFSLAVVGCESNHQFTGVPGAVDRSWKASGSLSGKLRPGLPLGHRRWRAPQTGQLDLQNAPNSVFPHGIFLDLLYKFDLESVNWEELSFLTVRLAYKSDSEASVLLLSLTG